VERDEEGVGVPLHFDRRAWGLLGEQQRRCNTIKFWFFGNRPCLVPKIFGKSTL